MDFFKDIIPFREGIFRPWIGLAPGKVVADFHRVFGPDVPVGPQYTQGQVDGLGGSEFASAVGFFAGIFLAGNDSRNHQRRHKEIAQSLHIHVFYLAAR